MRVLLTFFLLIPLIVNAKEVPNDAFVFSKIGCHGSCPVYEMIVFSDGITIFNGEDHVEYKGVYKLQLNDELFTKIIALTDKFEFNKFRDKYSGSKKDGCKGRRTDQPSTVLKLQHMGKIKSVYHYHGCKGFKREDELKELESQLIELLNLSVFIGT